MSALHAMRLNLGHLECYLTLWEELAMGLGYAMEATRSSTY
jgi:hypothetical protein